jgi:hypothetical protein
MFSAYFCHSSSVNMDPTNEITLIFICKNEDHGGIAVLRPSGAPKHSSFGGPLLVCNSIKTVICRKWFIRMERKTLI